MCPFPSVWSPFGTSKKPSVGTAPRYGHCLRFNGLVFTVIPFQCRNLLLGGLPTFCLCGLYDSLTYEYSTKKEL